MRRILDNIAEATSPVVADIVEVAGLSALMFLSLMMIPGMLYAVEVILEMLPQRRY